MGKENKKNKPTEEQSAILNNKKKKLIVSASAGSGKTFVVIEQLLKLVTIDKIPINRLLVLTFTKAAANEMKTRLFKGILQQKSSPFLIEQLDEISISDISTIDAFCEKIIKRNIDKLEIDENFKILDKKENENLKLKAFNKVFDKLATEDGNYFEEVYFAFKRNKEQIFKCMTDLQEYFDSQENGLDLIEKFSSDYQLYYKESLNFLNQFVLDNIKNAKKILDNLIINLPKVYQDFKDSLYNYTTLNLTDDFYQNCKRINNLELPSTPTNKIDDALAKEELVKAKEVIKDVLNITLNFSNIKQEDIISFEKGSLAKSILFMEKEYLQLYKQMKDDIDGLDFADLEKIVKFLLNDKDVLLSLQKSYDYIFIDEYQDTNPLQASIIKPIAKYGYFVAVGDPKQGIYGFRNASMEIMQRDIDEFSNNDDSGALYLTGNFRSDARVLNFINEIFNKVMTIDSVGIDYKNSSQLKGMVEFKKNNLPSVMVDIVASEKEENASPSSVYSIKNDKLSLSFKYRKEAMTIASRIEQFLKNKIYDAKKGEMREVKECDIAVLFRSRNQVMQETVRLLQEKGFNVFADLKNTLIEDNQIQILISLLKLVINYKDDISLVTVLNSWFGGFSLDELVEMRLDSEKTTPFYQVFKDVNSEKSKAFFKLLDDFKFNCQTIGIVKAFEKLFNECNYNLFINSLKDKNLKQYNIQEFFKLILTGNFQYNIAGLLDYLENIKSESSIANAGGDCLTVTTIHATKGLEYPIVILADCGGSLSKTYNKPYIINSKFGFGTYLYDYENDYKLNSPMFLASKLYKKNREFIDEIMIFYVALTRGQNHLVLIGTKNLKNLKKIQELFKCTSYIDLFLYSQSDNFLSQLKSQEIITTENYEYRIITDIKELNEYKNLGNEEINNNLFENIENVKNYIDFKYKNKEFCKINYKNSVSSILELDKQEEMQFLENFANNNQNANREEAILKGNAYHEALKLIDFCKVQDKESFSKELERIKILMSDGYFERIDLNLLYKNINLIKDIVKDNTVFKEQQFIMEGTLKDFLDIDNDKKIIVQGIVDLFALGKKNILIDYKFSSLKDGEKLLERYKKQLDLYKIAVENAFNIKIDKIYLLSLYQGQLIEYK